MHILITGGTGFIGKNLIKHLTEHQLTLLTRDIKKAKQTLQHARFLNMNYIQSLDELDDLNHIDVVINLAGEPIADKAWTKARKQSICQSRWQTTQKISQLILDSDTPPHTFISGSAIGFYGDQGETIVDESFAIDSPQGFPHQVCKQWEEHALAAASKTRVCILRTGIVLGAGGGMLQKIWLPFKLGLGGKIGHGQQYMPWIHIQDMILGICHLIKMEQVQGIFNFCSPHPVTNQEFSQTFAKALNKPAILPVPSPMLRIVMGESSCLILDSINAKPAHLTATGFDFTFPHLAPALRQVLRYHHDFVK